MTVMTTGIPFRLRCDEVVINSTSHCISSLYSIVEERRPRCGVYKLLYTVSWRCARHTFLQDDTIEIHLDICYRLPYMEIGIGPLSK